MTNKNLPMPSDWHIAEAIRRTCCQNPPKPEAVKKFPGGWEEVLAHARTLEEFIPAPQIDPDVEAVQRIIRVWFSQSTVGGSDAAALEQYKAEIAARLEGMQPKIGRVSEKTLLSIAGATWDSESGLRGARLILDHLGIDHD